MSPSFWLVLYDLRAQRRERGTLLLLGLALALSLLALWQGARFRESTGQALASAARQEAQAKVSAKAQAAAYFADPSAPAHDGLKWWRVPFDLRGHAFREHVGFAAKPPLAGSALGVAQGDVLPAYVRVRGDSMDSARNASEIEHPGRLAVGRFDLAFFVVYLWPLVLLALSTSVLTEDRESGRLRLLVLQGVRPWRLLLLQSVARCMAATSVLVVTVALAAWASGAVPDNRLGLRALLDWALVVVLYSGFWSTVAAGVCAWSRTRTTAAFAGFGAWVAWTLLLPALLVAAVTQASPVPHREDHIVAMRDTTDRVNAHRVPVLAQYYADHPQWAPRTTPLEQLPSALTRIPLAMAREQAMAGVEQRFAQAWQSRHGLFERWMPASPVTFAQETLARLAGNDTRRHATFMGEVQGHQERLRAFFNERLHQAAAADERNPCPTTCLPSYGFTDFDAVPRFAASEFLEEAPGPGVAAVTVLLGWTAGLMLLAALGAGWRAPRLRARGATVRRPDVAATHHRG